VLRTLHGTVVVDRVPLVRRGVTAALRGSRTNVVAEVSTGRDAVQMALDTGAAMVVVGELPDLTVAELVTALGPGTRPSVVALLDRAERDEIQQLLWLGVEGLLLRSADIDELVSSIRRVEGGERVVGLAFLASLVGTLDGITSGDPGARAPAPAPEILTSREYEVLVRMAKGGSSREIAADLCVAVPTVKTHLARIYRKLDAANRTEALSRAGSLGLLA